MTRLGYFYYGERVIFIGVSRLPVEYNGGMNALPDSSVVSAASSAVMGLYLVGGVHLTGFYF